jgi:flagellar motor protein MotB
MEAVGRSFYQPTATNDTEKNRALNRRVEILIAPTMELKAK